jgi:hypothetical protein
MPPPALSAPTRLLLRVLSSGVLLLVAANFVGQWWYWERQLPRLGLPVDRQQLLEGRLSLVWAAATLAAALGMFDLIGTLPRIRRLALICLAFCLAFVCVLCAVPYVTAHFRMR